jgi:hypothetical protein
MPWQVEPRSPRTDRAAPIVAGLSDNEQAEADRSYGNHSFACGLRVWAERPLLRLIAL